MVCDRLLILVEHQSTWSENIVVRVLLYVVETWKVWLKNGKETSRELLFTSTYKAYKETIEYNPY